MKKILLLTGVLSVASA
jgi:beta-galactosidase/beta-glucuronidase